jgi:ethanolamine utilization protein EutN
VATENCRDATGRVVHRASREAQRLTHTGEHITLAGMYLGIVKGTVVAERKAAGLEGKKLLLVQPVDEHGAAVGDLQAAVDTVQAGDGDLVYLVGSREAALACDPWFVPVDAAIVGIVDGIDVPRGAP